MTLDDDVHFTVRATHAGIECAERYRSLLVDPLRYVIDNFLKSSLTHSVGYLGWGPSGRCRFFINRISAQQQSCNVSLDPNVGFYGLTVREHQVASLVALGMTSLGISCLGPSASRNDHEKVPLTCDNRDCRDRLSTRPRSTLRVKTTRTHPRLHVDAAPSNAIGQAGGILLTEAVHVSGLAAALKQALAPIPFN